MLRRLATPLLLASAAACSSMQAISVQSLSETPRPVVYITNRSGVVVPVYDARLVGDTVVGKEVALPLNDVQRISVVGVSKGRTAMLISGIVVVVGVGAYAITTLASGYDPNFICDYSPSAYDELGGPRCGPPTGP